MYSIRWDNPVFERSRKMSDAIKNNSLEQVRNLIDQGVGFNRLYHLELACTLGHEEIMEALLKAGADASEVSWRNDSPMSCMQMAADARVLTVSMIKSLIAYGADVNFRDGSDQTILHYLAMGKYNDTDDNLLSAAKVLLENGACFYDEDEVGLSPLHLCLYGDNADLLKLFLAEGADVNFETRFGTLLKEVAGRCNIEMFDLLLNAGADRNLTAVALINPCMKNDHDMIRKILDTCDVDINMPLDQDIGLTILHYACGIRDITSETVQILLDHGANIRAVSLTGDTVLHSAAHCGDCSKIRQVLSYNLTLDTKNNENQTPLGTHIHSLNPATWNPKVSSHGRLDAFQMLRTAGAKITDDAKNQLNQLRIKYPKARLPDYEFSSARPLQEMCRLVIREMLPLPVDLSLQNFPIPKQLREYLNFTEF